jgi:DNA-binding transcriptional LysR family regulator
VRLSLAADELEKGRLLAPFPRSASLPTGLAYYLARRSGAERPEVSAFCAWLEREVGALRALGL